MIRHLLEKRRAHSDLSPENETDPDEVVDIALGELGLTPVKGQEVETRIEEVLKQDNLGAFSTLEKKHRFIMGILMNDFLGRVEGGRVAETLEDALKSNEERV